MIIRSETTCVQWVEEVEGLVRVVSEVEGMRPSTQGKSLLLDAEAVGSMMLA